MEHLGRETQRHGLSHASIYPYRAYPCRDGSLVIAIQNPAEWRRFCAGFLQQSALADDPRFADNPGRVANRAALDAIVAPRFAGLATAEAIARLDAHQIAWARVTSLPELPTHPALRRTVADLPDGSSFEVPRPAGRSGLKRSAVPSLGRDTERIRAEFA
jgi:crotonobetainyl-CoA:carnitine CoA-transferase CaiB-like acyl-CoA transferase